MAIASVTLAAGDRWNVCAEWPIRYIATTVYYAQHAYAATPGNNGTYTADVTALLPFADPNTLDGTCTVVPGEGVVRLVRLTH